MTVIKNFAAHLAGLDSGGATDSGLVHAHMADTVAAWAAGQASLEGKALAIDDAGAMPPLHGSELAGRIALAVAQTRLTEVDDIHMPSCTTPGSVIVPAALLLAAELGADNEAVRTAIRAGYEALAGTGMAIDGARVLYRGIWPTYLAAPLGVAAAAGRLLRLDANRMADALALALVQVSGAAGRPDHGRNARWLLAGWAAAAGLRAALAAARGFGGDTGLLDGAWFETTHGIGFDPGALASVQGRVLAQMSIKQACTAKQAAAALAAFQQVLASGTRVADIAKVEIHVPPAYLQMIAGQPQGRLGRIVSVQWQCALAALHPQESLDIERADHASERAFADLMQRTSVHGDETLAQHFPQTYPARVAVERHDGKRAQITVTSAPGDPGNRLSTQAHATKLAALLSKARGAQQANALLAELEGFRGGQRSARDLVFMLTRHA